MTTYVVVIQVDCTEHKKLYKIQLQFLSTINWCCLGNFNLKE